MNRDATPKPHEARRRRNDPVDSEAHAHRRATDADAVLRLHDRVDDGERRMDMVEAMLAGLVDSVKDLNQTIGRAADGLEALSNFKGFVLTMKLFSGAAKVMLPLLTVLTVLAGLGAAIVIFVKTGQWRVGS